ncbi:MAG: class I SAM-dependent methyltransferase [bacterium]|nr:class I SAM-dependent methyltransferase [bacterium]
MSQRSEASTIRYYDDHAQEYVSATAGIDMEALYRPFLEFVPEGGTILDAGCGSGRDAKAFLDRGNRVRAIDASAMMVEATSRRTGQPAQRLRFQELHSNDELDGIWACASLLHVPLAELDDVLSRFANALHPGGICYLSFKEGVGERMDGDRLFVDFTENSLRDRLRRQPSFEIVRTWITTDFRPGRSERWVNALVRKVEAERGND